MNDEKNSSPSPFSFKEKGKAPKGNIFKNNNRQGLSSVLQLMDKTKLSDRVILKELKKFSRSALP
jgi:hypothetical protein